MIKVIVVGALGRMGRTTCEAVMDADGLELAAAVDIAYANGDAAATDNLAATPRFASLKECLGSGEFDVAVDFTVPDQVLDNVKACLGKGVRCVVGTTGLDGARLQEIEAAARESGVGCLVAPNFAIGAVLLMELAKIAARYLPHCEIIELHHDGKLDAPSGTALRTADLIAADRREAPPVPGPEGNSARGVIYQGIPIHSVRLPGMVAHQEVVFGGQGQTLSIRHDSISRDSFMPGVVLAVRRVMDIDGLVVGLEKIM
ncbi:MAG: 4-hydroxy-tetrahydrodipicolinate reductase [Gaiellales bacterium]|nr:MAG: 4-hydroxy-tetrahydrodipicolinate reductase [Gaiellales bacterium]